MKTKVCFRKFPEGDVIAFMPQDTWQDGRGFTLVTSYQRIGQHAGASPELIDELPKASKKEYMALKKELELIGYKVTVIK